MPIYLFHLEVGPSFTGGMLNQLSLLVESLLVDGHDDRVKLFVKGGFLHECAWYVSGEVAMRKPKICHLCNDMSSEETRTELDDDIGVRHIESSIGLAFMRDFDHRQAEIAIK